MTNDVLNQIDDLKEFFTIDAWYLVKTFFTNLSDKLKEEGTPESQQRTIVEDLNYYISEFVGEYKNKEKLSYETALKLLREIGSPTDIILALESEKIPTKASEIEIKIKTTAQRICSNCHYPNTAEAIFCENCGKKFVSLNQLKERIIQETIDHIYLASFIVIYTVLGGLGFVLNTPYVPNPVERLAMSFGMLLVPSLVFSLIAGAILNLFTKEMKSFQVKYNMLLNHFEERFIWGFFFVFFGFLIFALFALFGFPWFLIIALLLLVTSVIWLLVLQGRKPEGVPYITLLTTKRMFSGFIQEKLTKINMYCGTIIVILLVIWNFFLYNLFFDPPIIFEGAILVSILQIIAVLFGLNGYLMMYYYSWSYVTRFIAQGVEKK